jgi:glycosyltransferase involved in cell wall biosynthesis
MVHGYNQDVDIRDLDEKEFRQTRGGLKGYPFVSVIVPCRDEIGRIRGCLDSILNNDYPAERFEIIAVDGRSRDGTKEALYAYTRRGVRVLDNPDLITASAMNIGIRAARGDIILKADAHSLFEADYISKCVEFMREYKADNIGGVITTLAGRRGMFAETVAAVLSSRFGVGGSKFRTGTDKPVWSDTAAFGCYRKATLEKLGLYNEKLKRGQDMELNRRLAGRDGRILLHPGLRIRYFASASVADFVVRSFRNGVWAILPFGRSECVPVSFRHLMPLFFVLFLGLCILLSGIQFFGRLLLLSAGIYFAAAVAAAIESAVRRRKFYLIFTAPFLFFLFHAVYGAGSLIGLIILTAQSLNRKT